MRVYEGRWERGKPTELAEFRRLTDEQWRLRHPGEPRPLGCVDCMKAACYPDCMGPYDDPRVKPFLDVRGTTMEGMWKHTRRAKRAKRATRAEGDGDDS